MAGATHVGLHAIGKRSRVLLASLVVLMAMFVTSATGAVSTASANYGCYLPPNGTCDSPQSQAGQYTVFGIFTYDRAGCVRALGYHGEPVTGWTCVAKQSQGSFYLPNPNNGWMRSSLKNNNASAGASFGGYYY